MKNLLTQILIIWGGVISYGLISNEALKGTFGTTLKNGAQNVANGFGV